MFVGGKLLSKAVLHLALLRAIILTATRCEYRASSKYLSIGESHYIALVIYESVKGGASCGPRLLPLMVHLVCLIPPASTHREALANSPSRVPYSPLFASAQEQIAIPTLPHPSSHPPFIDRNQTASTAETAVDTSGSYIHQVLCGCRCVRSWRVSASLPHVGET